VPVSSNNTLQVAFDRPRTFAAAKTHIASTAPERGRKAAFPIGDFYDMYILR